LPPIILRPQCRLRYAYYGIRKNCATDKLFEDTLFHDSGCGKIVHHECLIETLKNNGEKIVIPTPVLSEVLVHANSAEHQYLDNLEKSRNFQIVSFDKKAAIELAIIIRDSLSSGNLRAGTNATRAKLKFDRQIIPISRTQRQKTIYSDDKDIAKIGSALGIDVIATHQLPLPPDDRQTSLPL